MVFFRPQKVYSIPAVTHNRTCIKQCHEGSADAKSWKSPSVETEAQSGDAGEGLRRLRYETVRMAKAQMCDMCLAEACRLELWKHNAPNMPPVEEQCAHRRHCFPETSLGRRPTSLCSSQTQCGCSKRGRTQKHANERKSAKRCKRAQKGAKL